MSSAYATRHTIQFCTGRLAPRFKGLTTIARAQIEVNSADHIIVRIVPAAGFASLDVESLRCRLNLCLKNEVHCNFNLADNIASGPNGDFRAAIRNIPAPTPTGTSQPVLTAKTTGAAR